jgi:two-component system OmpR family sensor kinase
MMPTTTMTTTTRRTTTRPTTTTQAAAMTDPGTEPVSTSLATRARHALSSIRVRVVVGYVGLLLLGLVIAFLVTRQLLFARLDRQIERDLAQEVEELRQLAEDGNNPQTGEPFNDDAAAIFDTFLERNVPLDGEAFFTLVEGQPYRFSLDPPEQLLADPSLVERWAETEGPLRLDVSTPAGEARTLSVPLRSSDATNGVFIVAAFPRQAASELNDALRIIATTGLVVLVVTGVAAWSLAGRVVRPVRRLTETAQRISESDTSARIPVEGHDELAELGHTFNAMLDRLDTGMRSQRQFLDDVAHELRTPLTIARGHLEVSGRSTEGHEETVALVMDELDRMTRYVEDLLLLAKAEQQQFLRLGPADVGELVSSLVPRAKALGARRWVIDEAPRAGLVAMVADAGKIDQAMLNLVTNAVQHTVDGDEIGIGAHVDGERLQLWVRDTGPGVPANTRDHIFDRAARGASSRVSRPDGAGIGLSIVTAVVRAHRGTVVVTDTPGGGATFTIDIPLDPEASS